MWKILRLIRIRTIAFVAFTMYAMRYLVILPMLEINGFSLQMVDWAFTLLVIALCCLISGAYVINDYFDTKSDRISGVKDVVVGKSVSRRIAITLHSILNVVAVGIAFYLGYAVGVWKIGILFLLVSGILWFYSSTYKRVFIVGNLIPGILASLIPVAAIIYEIPLLNMAYSDILLQTNTNFIYMFNWVFGFSWFIFLNILIYEINKDIYTIEGDREDSIQSIPVRMGIHAAANIISVLVIISMVSATVIYFVEFSCSLAMRVYLVIAILLPYTIYIVSIKGKQGKYGKRKFQLRMIRLITVLCVGFSFLLKHFFDLIFMD